MSALEVARSAGMAVARLAVVAGGAAATQKAAAAAAPAAAAAGRRDHPAAALSAAAGRRATHDDPADASRRRAPDGQRRLSPAQTTVEPALGLQRRRAQLPCEPQHAADPRRLPGLPQDPRQRLTAANQRGRQRLQGAQLRRTLRSRPREAYMTQVYNYFALPPTLPAFCDAALAMSHELGGPVRPISTPFARAQPAAARGGVRELLRAYEQYRADLAAWEARYGAARRLAPATSRRAIVPTVATRSVATRPPPRALPATAARSSPTAPLRHSDAEPVADPVAQPSDGARILSSARGPFARGRALRGGIPRLALERGRSSAGRARRSQ